MKNLSEMLNDIENNKSVSINSYDFDKKLLDELICEIDNIDKLYPDKDCQNFIHLYAAYSNNTNKPQKINYHTILTAFIIGFGGGVFIAGVVTMIEQFVIRI